MNMESKPPAEQVETLPEASMQQKAPGTANSLRIRSRRDDDEAVEELLVKSHPVRDATFGVMYLMAKVKDIMTQRVAILCILLQSLQLFLIIFNSQQGWDIDVSTWWWRLISWPLIRLPVTQLAGYHTYVVGLYVLLAIVVLTITAMIMVAEWMRRQESASRRFPLLIRTVQVLCEAVFRVFHLAIVDYFVQVLNCDYPNYPRTPHLLWKDIECLKSPAVIHVVMAAVGIFITTVCAVCMAISACTLKPVGHTSPLARTEVPATAKVCLLEALYVVLAGALGSVYKVKIVLMLSCVTIAMYIKTQGARHYTIWINYAMVGLRFGCWLFPSALLVAAGFAAQDWTPAGAFQGPWMQYLLWGVWPAMVIGAACSWLYIKLATRGPIYKYITAERRGNFRKFNDPHQVALAARVALLHWGYTEDDEISQTGKDVFQRILEAGMLQFPKSILLHLMHAQFLILCEHRIADASLQLALAFKVPNPTMLDAFKLYVAEQDIMQVHMALGGTQQVFDFASYVQFLKAYRAVTAAHRRCLNLQCSIWTTLNSTDASGVISMKVLHQHICRLEELKHQTLQAYQFAIDRHPNHGKLLRAYGRFLEDVMDNIHAAHKFYNKASKLTNDWDLIDVSKDLVDDNATTLNMLGTKAATRQSSTRQPDGIKADGSIAEYRQTIEEEAPTADFKRAKALKKLIRVMCSKSVMGQLRRCNWHILGALGIMLVVHVACYAALTNELDSEHRQVPNTL
eukprot:jgi/Chrzof1/8916/Cz03g29020.t1